MIIIQQTIRSVAFALNGDGQIHPPPPLVWSEHHNGNTALPNHQDVPVTLCSSVSMLIEHSHSQLVTGNVPIIHRSVWILGKKSQSAWSRAFSGVLSVELNSESTFYLCCHKSSSEAKHRNNGRSSPYSSSIYLKFCRLQKSEANAVAVLSAVSAQWQADNVWQYCKLVITGPTDRLAKWTLHSAD